MGGFDDHGGITGDWMLPSPSPQSFFATMLADETGSQSVPEPANHDNSSDGGFTFLGPDRSIRLENSDVNHTVRKAGEFVDQKTGPRAGLVERMAARTGHNAPKLNTDVIKPVFCAQNQQTQSPYLTLSPSISPTSFLDSPVFLANSLVQPSPTTGKFQLTPNGNNIGNKSKDSFFEESDSISFAFKPFVDSAPLPCDNVNPSFMSAQSIQTNEALIQYGKQFQPQKMNFSLQMTTFEALNGNSDQTPQHYEEHLDDIDADHKINGDITNAISASSDDGYNWRKYGQKQVKGSEYPRSYYKCTHPNCPVKKKVERSFEGHITEIIYKGAHNHPKLDPNCRSGVDSSSDMQGDTSEHAADMQHKGGGHWGRESNFEVTSSAMVMRGQNSHFESSDAVDGSSTFSNEEEDDHATHGSVSLDYDGEGDESESKRRKVEAYAADVSGATRAIREPRVVVQTTSEVDILDDGYRWRKYGQKVVKGNPNPRSYYKCTSTGCTVRKHVERASHDLRSVITTYEGKHNHDVPAARNSSHNNTMVAAQHALSIQPQVQMHVPSRVQNTMPRFEKPPYGQQLDSASTHGYSYNPMSQQGPGGLAHMSMPAIPLHHYLN
ncbi:hypothetical protein R6Q59_033347 [Mikania micrantha]